MDVNKILGSVLIGIIGVAALTTVFGRKTTGPVVDALGKSFSGSISAALGKGVTL